MFFRVKDQNACRIKSFSISNFTLRLITSILTYGNDFSGSRQNCIFLTYADTNNLDLCHFNYALDTLSVIGKIYVFCNKNIYWRPFDIIMVMVALKTILCPLYL